MRGGALIYLFNVLVSGWQVTSSDEASASLFSLLEKSSVFRCKFWRYSIQTAPISAGWAAPLLSRGGDFVTPIRPSQWAWKGKLVHTRRPCHTSGKYTGLGYSSPVKQNVQSSWVRHLLCSCSFNRRTLGPLVPLRYLPSPV